MRSTFAAFLAALVGLSSMLILTACGDDDDWSRPTGPIGPVYEVEIRRTEGGIPHIKAEDFAGLGFGTGYAVAEDNVCILAENFVKYRAQLSRYFGPGEDDKNLNSDFFYQLMIDRGVADQEIPAEFEALFRGYAAGYNRYLRDTGIGNISDPACQGAAWVGEISIDDVRRVNTMPFFLPNFHPLFASAVPPGSGSAATEATTIPDLSTLERLANPVGAGSNGIALGRDATAAGTGMLLGNPHQPWEGTSRFYEFQQTIPGVMDMLGATTVDRANVGFGTTESVAWTNTVSKGLRHMFYMLQLDPTNPTAYRFDGELRDMIAEEVSVTVLNPGGSLEERTHTFYSTHFGLIAGGAFPWNAGMAFAVRIANEGVRNLYGAVASYQAKSVRELKSVHDQYQYMIVNTIAADSSGEVLFGDLGPLACLTDEQWQNCMVDARGPVLQGWRSDCQWCDDSDAATTGILPPDEVPSLFRDDYVTNSNDTYWLGNPEEPLTGYNISVRGGEKEVAERTLRTRSGLQMVQERLDGSDGLDGTKFTLDQLTDVALSNQNYAAQLLRDDLVTLIEANPIVDVLDDEGGVVATVDISEAGPILASWDLRANLESAGEILFREFLWEANDGVSNRMLPNTLNYTVPFDPEDPVATPRGLNTEDNPGALQAMAKAVQKLHDAGVALDASVGELQGVVRNGEFIPIHGGQEIEGIFNKTTSTFDSESGTYPVDEKASNSSWIFATEFTEDGPQFRSVLTYSLSANPNSPHYADQTKMYSQKKWLDVPFNDEDVEAATLEKTVLTEGPSDCLEDGWKEFGGPVFESAAECQGYFEGLQNGRITEFVTEMGSQ